VGALTTIVTAGPAGLALAFVILSMIGSIGALFCIAVEFDFEGERTRILGRHADDTPSPSSKIRRG
jgi:hypothetical protein